MNTAWCLRRDGPPTPAEESGMNPTLVHIRVMGPPEAVEQVTRRLYDVLTVAEESDDRPNRSDAGIRRYLVVHTAAPEDER